MIIGSNIIQHEKVSSTNSVAATLCSDGNLPEGTVITAGWQEKGKGQQGNKWESEAGMNLLFSIILYPSAIKADEQFYILKVIALGVYDVLTALTSDVKIKWPNDIYVKDDKIAGILIENSVMGSSIKNSIAGIGINVNQERFLSDAPNPVSLRMITGKVFDTGVFLKDVCKAIDKRYAMLRSGDRARLTTDYKDALYRYCRWHSFKDHEGEFSGMIEDVTDSGLLVVRKKVGTIKEYAFKEIEYQQPATSNNEQLVIDN
jgi:BirA family transcriptional regulator, biotin operon repressor / biotin---[acetyl-CoA-carboxylase] ligase